MSKDKKDKKVVNMKDYAAANRELKKLKESLMKPGQKPEDVWPEDTPPKKHEGDRSKHELDIMNCAFDQISERIPGAIMAAKMKVHKDPSYINHLLEQYVVVAATINRMSWMIHKICNDHGISGAAIQQYGEDFDCMVVLREPETWEFFDREGNG